jgi:hypothetical protein
VGQHGRGQSGCGRVEPTGSARRDRIIFFFEFIFNARNNSRKFRNYFKSMKNTLKIIKIPEKFLEID